MSQNKSPLSPLAAKTNLATLSSLKRSVCKHTGAILLEYERVHPCRTSLMEYTGYPPQFRIFDSVPRFFRKEFDEYQFHIPKRLITEKIISKSKVF